MWRDEAVVSLAEIEQRILTLRGQKVMLDSDLAELYDVSTKRLNEQGFDVVVSKPDEFGKFGCSIAWATQKAIRAKRSCG